MMNEHINLYTFSPFYRMYIFEIIQLLDHQPKLSILSSIKKCCPLHQSYKYEMGKRYCTNSSHPFKVNAIQAKFYENCIEDEEVNLLIDISIENNCKKSVYEC